MRIIIIIIIICNIYFNIPVTLNEPVKFLSIALCSCICFPFKQPTRKFSTLNGITSILFCIVNAVTQLSGWSFYNAYDNSRQQISINVPLLYRSIIIRVYLDLLRYSNTIIMLLDWIRYQRWKNLSMVWQYLYTINHNQTSPRLRAFFLV